MRWTLPCFAGLLFLGLALASHPTTTSPQPARRSLDPTDSRRYALQLQEVIVRIMQRYTRPVEAEELAGAALRGLYEAAQMPMPPTLQDEINRAAKEGSLSALLIKAREAVGNAEGLRENRAILASIEGMTKALDPFCALVPLDEVKPAGTEVYGPGLEFMNGSPGGALVIKNVALGGPAQRAGLRPGDQITRVNGRPAEKTTPQQMNFWEEKRVEFAFTRPGQAGTRTAIVRSESFRPEMVAGVSRRADNSWEYFLSPKDGIAHVRILGFNAELRVEPPTGTTVLQDLRAAGMRGLILDLRWCPGGFLDDARAVAYGFLGDYNIAYFSLPTPMNWAALPDLYFDNHVKNAGVWYRDGQTDYQPNARGELRDLHFSGFPMVVLVNAETSGGAELVAAVLQDNKRAWVVGQRTRGKASVQRPFPLTGEDPSMPLTIPIPGAKLKLSTGLLLRPSGKNLNRYPDSKPSDDWGVQPDADLEFRLSPDLDRRLKDWWQAQSLRPGTSSESLPLDDPANDSQRQAALELLQKALK